MLDIKLARRSFGLCACSLALLAAASVASAQAPRQVPAPVDCSAGVTGTDWIVHWTCPAGCACLAPFVQEDAQGNITAIQVRCGC